MDGGSFGTTSSGNIIAGDNNKSIGSPGTSNKIICVGAYSTKNQWASLEGGFYHLVPLPTISAIADFSSIGPSRDGRIKPDFVAPGNIIASCLSSSVTLGSSGTDSAWVLPGAKYQMMSGTSMSSPHATGTIALLLQRNKSLDYSGVFDLITNHTTQDSYTGTTAGNFYGYGKLNAWNAISNLVEDIKDPKFIPNKFSLSQNYPNPFNPTTTINFSLPENTNVKIDIFNQLGQKIIELVNAQFQSGNHSIQWNASHYPSGVYFYEMRTDKFTSVKKLILMK
jgi:subtilisin family serine protease